MSGSSWAKLLRFATIYGPRRAAVKAAGRLRRGRAWMVGLRPWGGRRSIGMIGCGQFAFSTIGYFLASRFGYCIRSCYDLDRVASNSFARFYGCRVATSANEVLCDPQISLVYIASNHSTHAAYTAEALRAGKDVYVEKPLSVTDDGMRALFLAASQSPGRLFAGYNRPFAAAIRRLRQACRAPQGPLTLCCTIAGHQIPTDHWYRHPEEGTRICGNVGHWLDLLVHILCWQELPDRWQIVCDWADETERDDNLTINLVSERGDLATIVLTARAEPFEGVREFIFLQWGEVMASIDDFRSMNLQVGAARRHYRYWPKDVGHRQAILQPFSVGTRNLDEVELSSRLMLRIADMVRDGRRQTSFSFGHPSHRAARPRQVRNGTASGDAAAVRSA